MKKAVLLQTLVSPELATFVRDQAKREGISVAAFLRRMIMSTHDGRKLIAGTRQFVRNVQRSRSR
jgi:hypothetical protein